MSLIWSVPQSRVGLVHDLFSASAVVSVGALYGNSGNDTFVLDGACNQCIYLRWRWQRLHDVGGAANTLTYEGGVGNDSMTVVGAVNSSTIYGDNCTATEGGADSISIGIQPVHTANSGSYIYLVGNLGNTDDSISIDGGVIASSVYGGEW